MIRPRTSLAPLRRRKQPLSETLLVPPAPTEAALSKFYGKNKRVDAREVTCVLHPSSLKLYFRVVLGEGKLDKEGRKDLGKKYFLDSKQYRRLCPPSLEEMKLHYIDSREYGLLSEKLLHSHR